MAATYIPRAWFRCKAVHGGVVPVKRNRQADHTCRMCGSIQFAARLGAERRLIMALIQWKDNYSVSVKRFDREHKELIALLNELNEAMAQGQGRFVTQNVLYRLQEYTQQHFAAEETAMRVAAYDGFEAHLAEHREFAGKVVKFASDFRRGDTSVTIEVLYFLRDWLQHHILGVDRKYSEVLNRIGIH
jgi:hemerythrin